MWVKCTGVGVFSIQEEIGESPQVSFLRGFVYSSQIKGRGFFTCEGLILLGFSSNIVGAGTFSVLWKSNDSRHHCFQRIDLDQNCSILYPKKCLWIVLRSPSNSHHLPSSLEDSQPVFDTPQLCDIPTQGDFVHH